MDSLTIYKKADKLVQSFGTRNPIEIAKGRGIEVTFVDYFNTLLGLYTCQYRKRAMYISNTIDESLTRIVAGHELGHDAFHRDFAKNGLTEFEIFRMKQMPIEYEVNAFASHILLDTEECIQLARNGYPIWDIARMMNSEINLLLIKFQELIKLGYDFKMPVTPTSDFLKNI